MSGAGTLLECRHRTPMARGSGREEGTGAGIRGGDCDRGGKAYHARKYASKGGRPAWDAGAIQPIMADTCW